MVTTLVCQRINLFHYQNAFGRFCKVNLIKYWVQVADWDRLSAEYSRNRPDTRKNKSMRIHPSEALNLLPQGVLLSRGRLPSLLIRNHPFHAHTFTSWGIEWAVGAFTRHFCTLTSFFSSWLEWSCSSLGMYISLFSRFAIHTLKQPCAY